MAIEAITFYLWCRDTFLLLMWPFTYEDYNLWSLFFNFIFWLVSLYALILLLTIVYVSLKNILDHRSQRLQYEDLERSRNRPTTLVVTAENAESQGTSSVATTLVTSAAPPSRGQTGVVTTEL